MASKIKLTKYASKYTFNFIHSKEKNKKNKKKFLDSISQLFRPISLFTLYAEIPKSRLYLLSHPILSSNTELGFPSTLPWSSFYQRHWCLSLGDPWSVLCSYSIWLSISFDTSIYSFLTMFSYFPPTSLVTPKSPPLSNLWNLISKHQSTSHLSSPLPFTSSPLSSPPLPCSLLSSFPPFTWSFPIPHFSKLYFSHLNLSSEL